MEFDALWQKMIQALREPELITVPEQAPGGQAERFHAWYDPGGDERPETIWTKPFQGAKQVRLPHRREDFMKVYEAFQKGSRDPAALREVALRGHYLWALMKRFGLS